MDPLLKAVCTIIGTSTVFGAAVFALIKYVNGQIRQAIIAHEEVVMSREETCSANKGGQIDQLVAAITKHVEANADTEELVNRRLNDVDLWRKEINGQIKRYGLQLEFQNKIAMEQKDVIKEIAHTTTQTSIKLAVIMQHLNISINQ
jgi:putative protein kinase ArgK-like GTPase of G3E family